MHLCSYQFYTAVQVSEEEHGLATNTALKETNAGVRVNRELR